MSKRIQPFTMPKWGIEMEEGVIREWRAAEGDALKTGDLLAVIETDKISNEVEMEYAGLLRRRIGAAGDAYKVGALIAVFAEPDVSDAEIDAFVSSFKAADASFLAGDYVANSMSAPSPRSAAIPEGSSISPKASELARSLGVDLSAFAGRAARISLQDVEQAAKAQGLFEQPAAEGADNPYTVIKLSAMRRTIAKRLTEATRTIPHFYLRARITMDALNALRAGLKSKGGAPTVNDFLIKACAKALTTVPEVNVTFAGDELRRFDHADIAVAVAAGDGLITPVVRRADQKSVAAISAEMKDFAARARSGALKQDEYRGGTFSLSNLGMYGVSSFDAVINPPMGAILAAGAAERAPLETGGYGAVMTATLSCDHRVIDGAVGGRFLAALKSALEAPEEL